MITLETLDIILVVGVLFWLVVAVLLWQFQPLMKLWKDKKERLLKK